MGVGRTCRSVAAALVWLGWTALTWAGTNAPAWPDGDLLAGAVERSVPARETDRAAIDRVGEDKFIASPWTPAVLGEPGPLIDRVLAEAFERAHRRVVAADTQVEEGPTIPTLADLDSGWDILAASDIGDRSRRLRMIAELVPVGDNLDVWAGQELQASDEPPTEVHAGSGTDTLIIRFFKDALGSFKSGTFFTRERIAVALGVLLTIGVFSHVRASRK